MEWFRSSMPFWVQCCQCLAWLSKTIWSGCSPLVSELDKRHFKVARATLTLFSSLCLSNTQANRPKITVLTLDAMCLIFAHVLTAVCCCWQRCALPSPPHRISWVMWICAFSHSVAALSHFSESILEYLANLDKAPDPTVRKDTFSSEIYASYDILFSNWLQSREAKVHLTRKSTAPIMANPVWAQGLCFCSNRSHGMPSGRPPDLVLWSCCSGQN